ncbi:MAG: aryl-sulfate sulfotransferase [Myxococcota bacterium]
MIALLLACVEPDPPRVVSGPEVVQPNPLVPYARELQVAYDRPVTLTITATDGRHAIDRVVGPGEAFAVPLAGLYADAAWTVSLDASDGGEVRHRELSFHTAPLPSKVPHLEVRSAIPGAAEPGYTLVPATIRGAGGWLLAVDLDGEIAWAFDAGEYPVLAPSAVPSSGGLGSSGSSGFRMLYRDQLIEMDWLGRDVHRLSALDDPENALDDDRPPGLPIDVPMFHHELHVTDRGTWIGFTREGRTLPSLPTSYDDPSLRAETAVTGDQLVELDPDDGTELGRWSVSDAIDPARIGYGSLEPAYLGVDWTHTNAVWDRGDERLVSIRHQDAVLLVDRPSGALKWILGTPDNWSPAFQDLLLEPVEVPGGPPFAWPWHQHGAKWLDGDRVLLFDNGNFGTAPFSGVEPLDGSRITSRVVEYAVDTAARTVSEVWSFTLDPPVYSSAMGDADELPNGHVLASFAYVQYEDHQPMAAFGRGSPSARVVEFDPATGQVVWDLDVFALAGEEADSWQVVRAARFAGF